MCGSNRKKNKKNTVATVKRSGQAIVTRVAGGLLEGIVIDVSLWGIFAGKKDYGNSKGEAEFSGGGRPAGNGFLSGDTPAKDKTCSDIHPTVSGAVGRQGGADGIRQPSFPGFPGRRLYRSAPEA